jgi:hypothetical protein
VQESDFSNLKQAIMRVIYGRFAGHSRWNQPDKQVGAGKI